MELYTMIVGLYTAMIDFAHFFLAVMSDASIVGNISTLLPLYVGLITVYSVLLVFLQLLESRNVSLISSFMSYAAVVQQNILYEMNAGKVPYATGKSKLDLVHGRVKDINTISSGDDFNASISWYVRFLVGANKILYGFIYRLLLLKGFSKSISSDRGDSSTNIITLQLVIVIFALVVEIFSTAFYPNSEFANIIRAIALTLFGTSIFTVLGLLAEELRATSLRIYVNEQIEYLTNMLKDE